MQFEVIDFASLGVGRCNEDRVFVGSAAAGVIDGATDLVVAPLLGESTDAAWLADEACTVFERICSEKRSGSPVDLRRLLEEATQDLADRCKRALGRFPNNRWEYPSAAVMLASACEDGIRWLSLGDCALIAETPDGVSTIGIGGAEAGDRRVIDALQDISSTGKAATSEAERRALLLPLLRRFRNQMNEPGGYGVLSLTMPQPEQIGSGRIEIAAGGTVLLGTDGFMRLIEIFGRYDPERLLDAAKTRGIANLADELREVEAGDAGCREFARLKTSDDASAVLLRLVA